MTARTDLDAALQFLTDGITAHVATLAASRKAGADDSYLVELTAKLKTLGTSLVNSISAPVTASPAAPVAPVTPVVAPVAAPISLVAPVTSIAPAPLPPVAPVAPVAAPAVVVAPVVAAPAVVASVTPVVPHEPSVMETMLAAVKAMGHQAP